MNNYFQQIESIASKQPALTNNDMRLRDDFIREYFEDFNEILAVIRLGYNTAYAEHMATQFMTDTYVRINIEKRKREPVNHDKEKLIAWVSNELMSRAQYDGPGRSESSKIMALKVFIDLHGLAVTPSIADNSNVIEGEFIVNESLTKDELVEQCKKRGLPTKIFETDIEI